MMRELNVKYTRSLINFRSSAINEEQAGFIVYKDGIKSSDFKCVIK